jgi:hypothetical protein
MNYFSSPKSYSMKGLLLVYKHTVVTVCSISKALNGVVMVLSFDLFNCADCWIVSEELNFRILAARDKVNLS